MTAVGCPEAGNAAWGEQGVSTGFSREVRVPPLLPGVLDELEQLDNGDLVPQHRERMLRSDVRFRETLRHIERRGVRPRALAELWLWLVHLEIARGSRPATTGQRYAFTVGRFLHWCDVAGVDFTRVTIGELDRWQQHLAMDLGNSPRYRAQQVFSLRSFYDWRRSRGLAPSNLAADLKGPKVPKRPAKKYTEDQLRAMFRTITDRSPKSLRDRCALLLLLATGMRREEMATLEVEQIEISRRVAVVRIHGKGAKERDVPFEGPAVEALHEWLAARDALPFPVNTRAVFVSLHGATVGEPLSMRSYETMVGARARAAKLRDWGMHRFRVTFATQLYDDGAGIETIRILLGHESIETTRGYLDVSDRARRTRLSADRQHRVLGTRATGTPAWARLAMGDLSRD